MIDTTVGEGHTVVIAGYFARQRKLLAVDPSEAAPSIREVEFAELARIWNSRGVGSDVRAAVFPKTTPPFRQPRGTLRKDP
jgi:hypothetical protein